jgi:hypothetical protein
MSNTYNWHDIQSRSAKFAAKWVTETDEKGEAKTFWDDFLREIFNIHGLGKIRLWAIRKPLPLFKHNRL